MYHPTTKQRQNPNNRHLPKTAVPTAHNPQTRATVSYVSQSPAITKAAPAPTGPEILNPPFMQNQEPKTEGQSVRTKALDQAQPDPGPKVKGEGNNPSDADDSDSLNPTRSWDIVQSVRLNPRYGDRDSEFITGGDSKVAGLGRAKRVLHPRTPMGAHP